MHVMTPIDTVKAQSIAQQHGLRPAKVRGTGVVQFTRAGGDHLEPIEWTDFQATLAERGLQVYESRGWLKIMK